MKTEYLVNPFTGTFDVTQERLRRGSRIRGLTDGSVLFVSNGQVLSQDNDNFFWDDTNNRLGIGTSLPNSLLHLVNSTASVSPLLIKLASSQSANSLDIKNYSGTTLFSVSSGGDLTKVRSVAYTFPSSQGGDRARLVNDGAGNLTWSQSDGWSLVNESWSYASSTTITVPSDATTRFQVGDKIKCTNSGTKYFYVVGVASTTLTVTGGTDYSVANAAISGIYVSRDSYPLGFPDFFNWTPTLSASGSMTYTSTSVTFARFKIIGKSFFFRTQFSGTCGGTLHARIIFSIPVTQQAQNLTGAATLSQGGSLEIGMCNLNSSTAWEVLRYNAGNYTAAGWTVFCYGWNELG